MILIVISCLQIGRSIEELEILKMDLSESSSPFDALNVSDRFLARSFGDCWG